MLLISVLTRYNTGFVSVNSFKNNAILYGDTAPFHFSIVFLKLCFDTFIPNRFFSSEPLIESNSSKNRQNFSKKD